jgi:hypothetical protein
MNTSDAQVSIARSIAKQIEKIEGVKECIVDDWSDYGLFSLWLLLDSELAQQSMSSKWKYRLRCNLISLTPAIKRILKKCDLCDVKIIHPKPTYYPKYVSYGKWSKEYNGHDGAQTNVQFRVQE